MAGSGTGVPVMHRCAMWRRIYWRSRTAVDDRQHQVELTGLIRKPKGNGKGHVRKSVLEFEYQCKCGHVGWSNHKDLERKAIADGLITEEQAK